MKKCIFCSIAESNIPHHKIIWEDTNHIAFLDINPSKEGHTLVIPKKHSLSHLELSPSEYSELFIAAESVSNLLKETLRANHIGLVIEGTSVPHTHIHLIPLKENEELAQFTQIHPTPEKLQETANKIRK